MCINLSYACLRTARSHPQCVAAGLDRIVVNGLEPITNRQTLELCDKYPHLLLPALGIYPLDACCHALASTASRLCVAPLCCSLIAATSASPSSFTLNFCAE